MTIENRVALFPELNYITDPKVYEFAVNSLAKIPEYFFHIPASSSGKYHPNYALGDGGLVRHVRAAMNIYHSMELSDAHMWYQWDCSLGLTGTAFNDAAYLALLFHDAFKSGKSDTNSDVPPNEHTVHEHPLLAASFLREQLRLYDNGSHDFSMIVLEAANAIASHMGKWNISKYSTVILPTPATGDWLARLVHLCDYLASRKELEFQFGGVDTNAN